MKKKWILRHCDLDLWPKVINFNRVPASGVSNRLAKTASKSVHTFGWNFVHKKNQTHRQTDTQTNCSENITPPRFCGGVIKIGRNWFLCQFKASWLYFWIQKRKIQNVDMSFLYGHSKKKKGAIILKPSLHLADLTCLLSGIHS